MKTSPGAASARLAPRGRAAGLLVFAGAVALVVLYGLRGGGSYDQLTFQENGLVIWCLLAMGIAVGLLPRARFSWLFVLLLVALVGYAAWTALSLVWTDSSELTSTEVARVVDYVGLLALVGAALDAATWRWAAAGLGVGALVVCVVAVGSRLEPSVFGRDQIDFILHQNRLSRPFGYWNAVGAWGAMTTAVGIAWSAHDGSRLRRGFALGAVPVATLTTYLTYSRAGYAETIIGTLLVLIICRNRITVVLHVLVVAAVTAGVVIAVRNAPQISQSTGTAGAASVFGALAAAIVICVVAASLTGGVDRLRFPPRSTRVLAGVAAVLIIAAAVAVGPRLARRAWRSFTRMPPTQSVNPTARLTNLSGTRYPLWKVTIKAFESHPLQGLGAGTIQFYWDMHATDSESIRDAHNIWLQNLAELGAPGLALIVTFVAVALAVAMKTRGRVKRMTSVGAAGGILAAFIVYLLAASVDWMWESTAITVLALAGIAVLGARLGRGPVRMRMPIRLTLVLVALGGAVIQLPGLLSTEAVRRSQAAEAKRDASSALAWAQGAVNAEPWSATAYQQLGLVRESAGQLGAAAADLERAIAREPQNYAHWVLLARIETERGQFEAAVRDYERAKQLYPRASIFAQGD